MIPGFNTDVEHGGVTYHVQTEDKGVASPIILSLVYQGGAILASKRTPYDDLLATSLDEAALAQRLQKQHKLICAAIRGGRIEDLKRMNERPPATTDAHGSTDGRAVKTATRGTENKAAEAKAEAKKPAKSSVETKSGARTKPVSSETLLLDLPIQEPPVTTAPSSTAHILKEGVADFVRRGAGEDAPALVLLEDKPLRAGEEVGLRVRLTRGDGKAAAPLAGVRVSIKVLGTTFGNVEHLAETDTDGVAAVRLGIPLFNKGRAVLMISAVYGGHETVLRRIVQSA